MMLRLSFSKWKYHLREMLPLLYPRHCPFCQMLLPYPSLVCKECAKKLPLISSPTCFRCGKPLNEERQELCYDCRIFPKSFEKGLALFIYNSMTQRAITAFKYHNQRDLSDFFSQAVYRMHSREIASWNVQAILPVPIHRNKRKKRGYNQAELIACQLAERLHIPCYKDLLIRTEDTPPMKEFSPQARLNHLTRAFAIHPRYLKGRDQKVFSSLQSLLLIDDIYTTGATMESCCRILKDAGVKKVYVYSLCIGISRDEIPS